MCELKQNDVWSMLIRGENFNLLALHSMLIVCQINDSSNPIACLIPNENFDPKEAYTRGTLLRILFISALSATTTSQSQIVIVNLFHFELFRYVDQVYFLQTASQTPSRRSPVWWLSPLATPQVWHRSMPVWLLRCSQKRYFNWLALFNMRLRWGDPSCWKHSC